MFEIISKDKLPEKHTLSKHLLDKAEHFAVINLYGVSYYIPIGFHERRLMGMQIKNGQLIFKVHRNSEYWDEFLRTIIDSVYMQTRDTVGAEIKDELLSNIQDSFDNLLGRGLEVAIDKRLPKPFESTDVPVPSISAFRT
jgi:hypothetical protein